MSKKLLLLLFLCGFIPNLANAVEALNYNKELGITLEHQVNLFLNKNYNSNLSNYSIAAIDLNNDGLDEYVLREKRCIISKSQCYHLVIAENKNTIIELLKIKTQNIMIGETYSHGIKDLLVFKNQINDYDFDIYIWSPEQKMYIIKANEAENQN